MQALYSPLLQPGAFRLLPATPNMQALFSAQGLKACTINTLQPVGTVIQVFSCLQSASYSGARDLSCASCAAGAQCVAVLQVVPPRAFTQCIANFQIGLATIPLPPLPWQIPYVMFDDSIPARRATINRTLVVAPPCDPRQYTCSDTNSSGGTAISCSPVPCSLRWGGLLRAGAADSLARSDALRAELICLSCLANHGTLAVHTLPHAGLLWPVPPLLRPTLPCWVTAAAAMRPRS